MRLFWWENYCNGVNEWLFKDDIVMTKSSDAVLESFLTFRTRLLKGLMLVPKNDFFVLGWQVNISYTPHFFFFLVTNKQFFF